MIPFQPQIIAGAIALAVGFGAGWKVQGWRWDASLTTQSNERARLAAQATADLVAASRAQEYIAKSYEQEKIDALAKKDAVIADLRRGAIRLRDPGAGVPACPDAPAGPRLGDGSALAKLPDSTAGALSIDASEFLISIVTDADSIVAQLTACQALVRSDRSKG